MPFFTAAFSTMLAWLFVMGAWALPLLGSYGSTPAAVAAVEALRDEARETLPVAALGYEEPSLVFSLGGNVEFLDGADDFAAESLRVSPRIVLVSEDRMAVLDKVDLTFLSVGGGARGFNFAKGRWEPLQLFLDYGAPEFTDAAMGEENAGE